jgi:hypothetical protein
MNPEHLKERVVPTPEVKKKVRASPCECAKCNARGLALFSNSVYLTPCFVAPDRSAVSGRDATRRANALV